MNATITKFGYPATLIADYRHWVVLLRLQQPTLGSLILAARGEATAFSALPADAFAELATITTAIERVLAGTIAYDRLNYLMLMMVDPHVHFHIIPRYAGTRTAAGLEKADPGWPATPALSDALTLDAARIAGLRDLLKSHWPAA